MLSRYQKSGGFIQILQLIETCGKTKQDNFLQMIEAEDRRWADAIREKMLTMEKIFSWDPTVIAEISGKLQELTIATAMHGLKPEDTDKLLRTFSHSQRRNIEDLSKSKASTTAEISSAYLKIITEVRKMITQGYLRPEKFAPECVIPEGYEEKLGKASFQPTKITESATTANGTVLTFDAPTSTVTPTSHGHSHAQSRSDNHDAEVSQLRTKVHSLASENEKLRSELKIYKEKIEQIRKIA